MPSAADTLRWLESLSPWPEEFGVGRMRKLLRRLGDPQLAYRAIHVVGTNGKTTTTRMIAHVLQATGLAVGMTTTDGVWVGGACLTTGDTTGPASARLVLADPTVEVAVLETARGGIVRRGLGFDWADLAVMTNVSVDHLGQDGIRTVDDLYRIKRRVAERVRAGGALVLNADDERLARLPDDPAVAGVDRRVVYFSLLPDSPVVARHRARGGRAFFLRAGWIVEAEGAAERPILGADEVPVTMGGAARFQVANTLAACAALRAHGVAPEQVAAGLRTFSACAHNAGRANLYRLGEGYVMLDYGHNPDGYANVCALAAHWRRAGRRVTGIIAAPGDRVDEVIQTSARTAAAGFTRLIVREDRDFRGRAPGETARLLCEAACTARPGIECTVVPDAVEALRGELDRVRGGEIAVLFYEKLGPLRALLDAEGAVPAEAVVERTAPRVHRRAV
jgi:cyanophycin synthetase